MHRAAWRLALAVLFAASGLGAQEALPETQPSSSTANPAPAGPVRTLRFPEDRSLGYLYTMLPQDLTVEQLGEAKGEIQVDAGLHVWLQVEFNAAADLSPLVKLAPDDLYGIDLSATLVTDDQLRHLAGLTGLRNLLLNGTAITGEGLWHLRPLVNLELINLSDTAANDAALDHLQAMIFLKRLFLANTKITKAGLAKIAALPALESLNLFGTRIDDNGLASLRNATKLRDLGLAHTKVGDAGLQHVVAIPSLERLDLSGLKVHDESAKGLVLLTKLIWLGLDATPFTKLGVQELQKGLPSCQISNPHYVPPTPAPVPTPTPVGAPFV